jgi:hypothetical protein
MVQPMLPIFVANDEDDEDDDLRVAPSVAGAAGDMEPPEVGEGHHLVFDATGRRGHLKIDRFDIVVERWDYAPDVPGLRSRIDRCLHSYALAINETLRATVIAEQVTRDTVFGMIFVDFSSTR